MGGCFNGKISYNQGIMKLYFVRHGESAANVVHEFSNTGLKHPLTEKGIQQAQAVGRSLAGVQFEQIYSSPILRAMQTAHILSKSLHAPLKISEALREWSVGVYEGSRDPRGWAMHSQVQEDWFSRQDFDSKMPGGESFNEMKARFVPFIEELVQEWQGTEGNVLLVGHGGLYLAMLPALCANIDFAFAHRQGFPYTGTTIVARSNGAEQSGGLKRPGGMQCLAWCGVPFEV